jgi:hypothetical protein
MILPSFTLTTPILLISRPALGSLYTAFVECITRLKFCFFHILLTLEYWVLWFLLHSPAIYDFTEFYTYRTYFANFTPCTRQFIHCLCRVYNTSKILLLPYPSHTGILGAVVFILQSPAIYDFTESYTIRTYFANFTPCTRQFIHCVNSLA